MEHPSSNETKEKHTFYKFPRTRHVFDAGGRRKLKGVILTLNLGGVGRDDLLMTEQELKEFLKNDLYLEEKVDGANLGISMEDYKITFQNRSHYVTSATSQQWKALDNWVEQHPGLYNFLTEDIILFGEWLYAKHSIHYTSLPDYFLAFDIWDKKKQKFLSIKERNKLLEGSGICTVPLLAHGRPSSLCFNFKFDILHHFIHMNTEIDEGKFTKEQLKSMLQKKSQFYDGPLEGIYFRVDDDKYLKDRAKVVRHDFLTHNGDGEVEHWSKAKLVKNIVKYT